MNEQLNRDQTLGLIAMSVAVLVVANDFTALSVAIPSIEGDFKVDLTTAQWVINGYAMVFGVLIVTGGRLADMFGRRKAFFVGAVIFALFSVVGGFAPDVGVLLAARFLMGVGGALMWPAILGMTYALLPPSRAGLAGGIILGAAGFGNAIGPLIGGALTDSIGWRWIFFLNLPIAAFAILVTFKVVGNDAPDRTGQRIDYAGVAALSVGVLALLLALDEGTDLGWTDPYILGLFGLGAVAMVIFAVIERRAGRWALVPSDVLGNRQFAAACLATLMISAIFFSALLYLPQFMAKQLGFSAVGAGAGLLPMMGVFALTSFISGPLYSRLGPKLIVAAGAACLAVGIFLLSRITPQTTFPRPCPRPGGARRRRRAVLFVGNDGRDHGNRQIEVEPRRCDHLHGADRRRLDRPWPQHGACRDRGEPHRGYQHSVQGRRGARRRRARGRRSLHRRQGRPGKAPDDDAPSPRPRMSRSGRLARRCQADQPYDCGRDGG